MKRAYRERALKRLFADLQSGDFDMREHAIFQLVQLLRRVNAVDSSAADFADEEQLSRHLRRLRLSAADQRQVADRLAQMMSRHAASRASALWALGEVSADIGFGAVVAAIQAHGDKFSDEAAYQACRALEQWLRTGAGDTDAFARRLDAKGALALLKRWSRSKDARLAKSAFSVLRGAKL